MVSMLPIDENRRYTRGEVAALLNVKPETVKGWQLVGLRNKQGGVFSLETSYVGGSCRVLGVHLKKFLDRCQRDT